MILGLEFSRRRGVERGEKRSVQMVHEHFPLYRQRSIREIINPMAEVYGN